jgi:hypothetical protein
MYEALFATIRMGDVIDELDLVHLVGIIPGANHLAANNVPPIRSRKLGFVTTFPFQIIRHKHFERRVEEIKDQSSPLDQMPVNRLQTGKLIIDGGEVLEWPEWQGDESEGLSQVKISHVGLDEPGLGPDRPTPVPLRRRNRCLHVCDMKQHSRRDLQ